MALPTPGHISPADAHTRARGGDAVLLDVREEGEYAAGHAPEAVLLPLNLLVSGAPLPPGAGGRPVLCVCRSGRRSQQATEILTARGVTAFNVTGGMQAWARAGLPIRTGQEQQGQAG